MKRITADYIFPGNASPIKEGVIVIDDSDKIISISEQRNGDEEYYKGIICPGFVNVHCHTELSFAKGKINRKQGINKFINELESLKRSTSIEDKQNAVIEALTEMQNNGIVAVGDIINTDLSIDIKEKSVIKFYNFIEVFGSQYKDAEKIWYKALALFERANSPKNIIPHAPYSLSRTLFQKLRDFQKPNETLSIHAMESKGEAEYFLKGSGPIADRMKSWGLEIPPNIPSRQRPLASIGSFLAQSDRVLMIHNTFIEQEDIEFAKQNFRNTFYGICPNANLFIESELPPLDLLQKQGVNICLGTDSLASNASLSILDEMKTLQLEFNIPLVDLVLWATYNGARALGMDMHLGSIEKGKTPGLILIENIDSEDGLSNAVACIV